MEKCRWTLHLAKLLGLRGSFFIIPLYSGVEASTDTSAVLFGLTAHTFPEILYSSAEKLVRPKTREVLNRTRKTSTVV